MYEALRHGVEPEELVRITHMNIWFVKEMKALVDFEEAIRSSPWSSLSDANLKKAKEWGFSDKYLSKLFNVKESVVRSRRQALIGDARFEPVPVSGVKDAAYYYSTYSAGEDMVPVSGKRKVMILGGGPNRIGQG